MSSSLPLLAACAWMVAGEGGTIMLENRAPKIFLGVFLAISVAPALAHDPSHPELNGGFDKLASGRGLCCSDADGTALSDVDWESKDGHYRVRLGGNGSMFQMMP